MKKWKRWLPIPMLAMLFVIVAIFAIPAEAESTEDSTISERVYIGEISVGGLDPQEARERVQAFIDELSNDKITLAAGENTIDVSLADLGLAWGNPEVLEEAAALGKAGNLIARYKAMKDLQQSDKVYPIIYTVDSGKISEFIEAEREELETEALDATLSRENGTFSIVPGSQGVGIDVGASVSAVAEHFNNPWQPGDIIALVATVTEPRGTTEELSKVRDLLGTFTTNFSGSAAGRVKNVQTGAGKLNSRLLYPGDVLSVHEVVTPFTANNGYALAGSFENGTVVETYGGGICQVSTTLYNAVIRAELEITERHPHSMIVTYVDPSKDAAIAGTWKDLKFKNTTDAPVYIEGYTSGRDLTFNIYGQDADPNRTVDFISETTSTTQPGTVFQAAAAPIGSISRTQSSHTGKTAVLWKVVYENGAEVSRTEFNRSRYMASPNIFGVGVHSDNPEAVANINAALATQDEGVIRGTAAAWAGGQAPPPPPADAPAPEQPAPPAEAPAPEQPAPPAEAPPVEAPPAPEG